MKAWLAGAPVNSNVAICSNAATRAIVDTLALMTTYVDGSASDTQAGYGSLADICARGV